jgi:hypothetical protein
MPNGFHGSEKKWKRIEAPLQTLDIVLRAYAEQYGMSFSSNYHNFPERSLVWGSSIRRLIQIYLDNEEPMTCSFWICASEDRDGNRFWKKAYLRSGVCIQDIQKDIQVLLDSGRKQLEQWQSESLEFATELEM